MLKLLMKNLSNADRSALMFDLEAAKREQSRCMGGVDPAGCVAASQAITALRLELRDDTAFFQHLLHVIDNPASVKPPRSKRAPRA